MPFYRVFLLSLLSITLSFYSHSEVVESFESNQLSDKWANDKSNSADWEIVSDVGENSTHSLRSPKGLAYGETVSISYSATFEASRLSFSVLRSHNYSLSSVLTVLVDDVEVSYTTSTGDNSQFVTVFLDISEGFHSVTFQYASQGNNDQAWLDNLAVLRNEQMWRSPHGFITSEDDAIVAYDSEGTVIHQLYLDNYCYNIRDVAFLGSDKLAVYCRPDYHSAANLLLYNLDTKAIEQQYYPGLHSGQDSTGGIDSYRQFVFMSGAYDATGIVRFNTSNGTSGLYLAGTPYAQVAMGRNGRLYGLRTDYVSVDEINPLTMALTKTHAVQSNTRGIAVDAEGYLYTANFNELVTKWDSNGNIVAEVSRSAVAGDSDFNDLFDIEVLENGDIAVSSRYSSVFIFDSNLAFKNIEVNGTFIGTRNAPADADQDALPDYWEVYWGLDDDAANTGSSDFDADTLSNLQEYHLNINPTRGDSDGDGLSDAGEVNVRKTDPTNSDTDGDGLADGIEVYVHKTDPLLRDTDGDTLSDFEEIANLGTDPLLNDTDNDGMDDGWEIDNFLDPLTHSRANDADGDGLADIGEYNQGSDPNKADTDGDGLTDGQEVHIHGTSPTNQDTDGDIMPDGWEVGANLSPTTPIDAALDMDSDGYTNLSEYYGGSDPNDASSLPKFDSWTQWRGNSANTGFIPLQLAASNFTEKWRYKFDDLIISDPGMAINGLVYIGEHDPAGDSQKEGVFAISNRTGELIWNAVEGDAGRANIPAYFNGEILAINGYDETMVQRNPFDGALIGTQSPGLWFASTSQFLITESFVGLNTHNSLNVYESGNFDTPSVLISQHSHDSYRKPAYSSELGLISIFNNKLIKTDVDTGTSTIKELNSFVSGECGAGYEEAFVPVLTGRSIVVTAYDKCLMAVKADDGAVMWHTDLNLDVKSEVSFVNGIVYVVNNRLNQLEARSLTDGSLLWSWGESLDTLNGSLVATLSHVFVSDSQYTYPIDLNTQQSAISISAGGRLALSDEGLLLISATSELVAINIEGDIDNDGLPDWWERKFGLAVNEASNRLQDADADGLSNLGEYLANADPTMADTDGDGASDGEEYHKGKSNPRLTDTDKDGLSDSAEMNTHLTDPTNFDSDGDGLSDYAEVINYLTDPNLNDSDADGLPDDYEVKNSLDPLTSNLGVDTDSDGLGDVGEYSRGSDPNNPDSDGDGLTDGAEHHAHGTNPTSPDTDGDHIDDKWEIDNGLSATDASDAQLDGDSDSYSNLQEFLGSSDPADSTSLPQFHAWSQSYGNAQNTSFIPLQLDSKDFSIRWTYTDEQGRYTPAIAANGMVFSTSPWGSAPVLALDGKSGALVWSNDTLTKNASAAIINGPLHIGLEQDSFFGSSLVKRDSYTGRQVDVKPLAVYDMDEEMILQTTDSLILPNYWDVYRFDFDLNSVNEFAERARYRQRKPAYDEEVGFVYFSNYDLHVMDAVTNTVVSHHVGDLAQECDFNGSEGAVSIVANRGKIIARLGECLTFLEPVTGDVLWSIVQLGHEDYVPAVAFDRVYAVNKNTKTLDVRDIKDGSLLWSWKASQTLRSDVVVTLSHAFVSDADATHAIDLNTRQKVATFDAAGKLSLSDEGLLLISGSGNITAVNIEGDADGDTLPDWWERKFGLNPNDNSDKLEDADADGLSNFGEYLQNSDPNIVDSDNDGLTDGQEFHQAKSNPRDSDSDNDGLTDAEEFVTHRTNPNLVDSDDDGLDDNYEIIVSLTNPTSNDTDNDSLPDGWEHYNGLDANTPNTGDTDSDGVKDTGEYILGTLPTVADTDGDGLTDGAEHHTHKTDPLAIDSDSDLLTDGMEVKSGLNPVFSNTDLDVDGDGFDDVLEVLGGSEPKNSLSQPKAETWTTFAGSFKRRNFVPVKLDPNNIDELWRADYDVDKPVAMGQGAVYTVSYDTVYAIDQETGKIRWTRSDLHTGGHAEGLKGVSTTDDLVFVQVGQHAASYVAALDPLSGSTLYTVSYSPQWHDFYATTVVNGTLLIPDEGAVIGADVTNGEKLWTVSVPDYFDGWAPSSDGKSVFAHVESGLTVVSLEDGSKSAFIEDPLYDWTGYGMKLAQISGHYDNVVGYQNRHLVSFNTPGRKVNYAVETGKSLQSQPALHRGKVFVPGYYSLLVFNELTGEQISITNLMYNPRSILATANHLLISASNTTYVYSVDDMTQQIATLPHGGQLALSKGVLTISNRDAIVAYDISVDADNDGLPDWWEQNYGLLATRAGDASWDLDRDGVNNLTEYRLGSNPRAKDTDGDALPDAYEVAQGLDILSDDSQVDADSDGLTNIEEYTHGMAAGDGTDASADWDNDGLSNLEEVRASTDLNNPDSDGDGTVDGSDSDPLDASVGGSVKVLDTDINGYEDVTLLASRNGTNTVALFDSQSGAELQGLTFSDGFAPEVMTPVADSDKNGVADVIVGGITSGGQPELRHYDGQGSLIKVMTYPVWLMPTVHLNVVEVDDVNGNGGFDIAVLFTLESGQEAAAVFDLTTGNRISALKVPSRFDAVDIWGVSAQQSGGNGELSIIAFDAMNDGIRLYFNALTGSLARQYFWPGYVNVDKVMEGPVSVAGRGTSVALGSNRSGIPVLAVNTVDSLYMSNIVSLPGWLTVHEIMLIDDTSGDGTGEVVILAQTPAGRWLWRSLSVVQGTTTVQRQVVYPGWFTPSSIGVINDTDGNGMQEVLTQGVTSGGVKIWLRHDAFSGQNNGYITITSDLLH